MIKCISGITVLLLVVSSAAAGQTCVGLPSTIVTRANLSASVGKGADATSFGARFGFGGKSAFAGLSVERANLDDTDISGTRFGGDAGLQFSTSSSGKVSVCPLLQASYYTLGTISTGFNEIGLSAIEGILGMAIGGEVEVSPTFVVVPHASAGYGVSRTTLSSDGIDESENSNGGVIAGGISLLFSKIFAIKTGVAVPVGNEGGNDPTYSLTLSIGFGKR